MLDIVMVGHRPNYARIAHRGLDVKGALTTSVIKGSLPSMVDLVGTPGKVVLSLEGGTHHDFEAAEAYLHSQMLAWQIVHANELTSFYEAMMRGLEKCQSQLVAIVPAWVEVTDKQWVQRMIWALGKDPTALLCGTFAEQGGARDLAPCIVQQRAWPGGDFFVARRVKLWENLKLCNQPDKPWQQQLADAASANGWRIWAHAGVRFQVLEHEAHERRSTVGTKAGTAKGRSRRRHEADLP
jgi:hypothetical protein